MPAIIVREYDDPTLTILAQTGGEETTSSLFAQTDSESENSVFVFKAYMQSSPQTEQMLFSENFIPSRVR
jgi:hypothetical protein